MDHGRKVSYDIQALAQSTKISLIFLPANRLADELLSEVVDEVSEELGELCDGYVDRLFSNEFARPPTPTLL